ncbi:AP-4 complex subunit epsilon [Camellia lanceoleosa]|uniref:AP-4 complex subunit epsilon n=1 Tax=Camellia lanceoleosa TaxID=1840588 RepID=A0ACC0FXG2_9ERIC|nr:AP-4 complex subunit epsilon [Camellia lanceoleosa]
MGATLGPLFDLITIDANSYKDLVISFVSILKLVAERRLPKIYEYHQMAAPFIQALVSLSLILGFYGEVWTELFNCEHMYTVVGDIMRKCDSSSNIGNAVLYQCICCVSSIHPNPKLLDAAADAISKFLKSGSHNLKYMGIDALGRLIKISPEIAIDCLEDPDNTLKRKTFELLYKMTKSSNLEVIVDCMIDYMTNINDHYKAEIASRCVELVEQFAPSNHCFIQVESYLCIIGEPKLPSAFLQFQVICWVFGEYGTADGQHSGSYITGKLCDVAEAHSSDDTVNYVQQSLENGAQPYIPEDERSGILNISSFRKQDHHEASTHSLWFEAYELPKPTVPMPSRAPPVSLASSTELVPIPEPSYPREMHQTTAVPSVSDTGPSELKLRLDGFQRKRGRPTYSSPAPSTPSSSLQRPMNGVTQPDGTGNLNSKPCDTSYSSRRSQVQIYSEKQKLAASLLGGPSKPEERSSSTAPDVMPASGQSSTIANPLLSNTDDINIISGLLNATNTTSHGGSSVMHPTQLRVGPNPKDSLDKDALVRQMGVTPLSQNPNLFRDLLG